MGPAHVNNWKNTFLSQARKEVLLKSVVQAISTYAMSMFLIPQKTCKDIASLMSILIGLNAKRIHCLLKKMEAFRQN